MGSVALGGVDRVVQGGFRLGVTLEQIELVLRGLHIDLHDVCDPSLDMGGGDSGLALLQAGEDKVDRGAV